MKIFWHGFLEWAVKEFPKEACGLLFSKLPYSEKEEWHVYYIKNIHATPLRAWHPDKKEMKMIKKEALNRGLVLIGNIHTHPYKRQATVETLLMPSKTDLFYAKKYNDIIRGILVIRNKVIHGIRFHDKFGNEIQIILEEK